MVIAANTDERNAALRRPRQLAASDRDPSNRSEITRSETSASPQPETIEATAAAATVEVLDPTKVRHRLMMADAAATLIGLVVAIGISVVFNSIHGPALQRHLALTAAGLPAFAAGAAINQLYRARANARLTEEMFNIVRTVLIGLGFMVCVAFAVQMKDLSRAWIALIGIWVTSMLMIERLAAREVFLRLRATGRLRRRVVIVGTDEHAGISTSCSRTIRASATRPSDSSANRVGTTLRYSARSTRSKRSSSTAVHPGSSSTPTPCSIPRSTR